MEAMSPLPEVDAHDWKDWVTNSGGVLLDVRQPDEWELGTLPEAILIPMAEIPNRLDELPRDQPILCVCRSGSRSARVADFLETMGFEGAVNMAGGMKALGMQD